MKTLTEAQKRLWNTDGYLHLDSVLNADQVAFFSNQLDRIRHQPGFEPDNNPDLPIGHYSWQEHSKDLDPNGFMDRHDLLSYHPAFVDLIDQTPAFDFVVDLLGVNIMLSLSQAVVREPSETFPGYTHTDGGESLRNIRVAAGCPPIAMKVMYLLTDVTAPDTSNFTIFPGSHLRQFPDSSDRKITPYTPGAVQLMGKAGDAYLFSHALWHGPSKNLSDRSRRVILYNYCQLWARSYDYQAVPEQAKQASARQRRLLGDLGYGFRPGAHFYVPKDQEQIIRGE